MAATFHLTDDTTITGVTTYATVHPSPDHSDALRYLLAEQGPVYSLFTADGHRYVAVNAVRSIDTDRQVSGLAWYDLPVAAGMWAADGADLNA
jgi:hypothetical protein